MLVKELLNALQLMEGVLGLMIMRIVLKELIEDAFAMVVKVLALIL